MAVQLNEREIERALKSLIVNGSLGLSVVQPNRTAPDDRPYVELQFAASSREGGALKGQADIEQITGVLAAIVVVDNDTYSGQAADYAMDVAALCPEGTKIDITNGQIVLGLPDIKEGFEGRGQWRKPVMVPYRASRV